MSIEVNFLNGYASGNNRKFYVKSSSHAASVEFSVSSGGEVPSGWTPDFVEVSETEITDTLPLLEGDFEDYPCRFTAAQASLEDLGGGAMRISLPYGAPPMLDRERVVIPGTVLADRSDATLGSLGGTYSLLTWKEANRLVSGSYTEATYTGYAKIYERTGAGMQTMYVRAYSRYSSGSPVYAWCVSELAAAPSIGDDHYYVASAMDGRESEYAGDPASALLRYRYANDDGGMEPGVDNYYEADVEMLQRGSENSRSKGLNIRLSDSNGNASAAAGIVVEIRTEAPRAVSIVLTGSTGDRNYTGMYMKDGRFFPCEYVKASVSAASEIPIEYRLTGGVWAAGLTGSSGDYAWRPLTSGETLDVMARLKPGNGYDTAMGADQDVTIGVVVRDAAGNVAGPVTASIRYVTRLFRTAHENLVEDTASEKQSVYSVSGMTRTPILRSVISTARNDYTRSWNEIWYPESHGAPLNEDGSIDEAEATRISKPITDQSGAAGPTAEELTIYDRLAMNSDYTELLRDDEGRFYCSATDWSQSKTYGNMENSRLSDRSYSRYWIVDNTGNPDFRLEFEYFDFSGDVTSLPANLVAPYDGDMLSVYDASDPDAVETTYDGLGNPVYTLSDSSKLVHLFTAKGSYRQSEHNPIKLVDSTLQGSITLTDCGFTTPNISSCSRVCIVPFTDYGPSVASGFKLKAGPKRRRTLLNFDSSDATGEFWIHVCPQSSASGAWQSADELMIDYRYYESFATTDCETASVEFDGRLDHPVLATFNSYLYLGTDGSCRTPYGYFSAYYDPSAESGNTDSAGSPHCIRAFAASEDDMVDYIEPSLYVRRTGYDPVNAVYDGEDELEGRLVRGYSMNRDTGVLSFFDTASVPLGRLFGTYSHHTFYRLTSDGYGDLYFYGSGILVPASVNNSYTDWTYVDLKIVNEGTNTLYDGLLQFLARGYITTGTVVDTVLDNNRPWDVQEGTTAETVQRTGARVSTSYSELNNGELSRATRSNAFETRKSQSASLGVIEPRGAVYVRVFWCIANNAQGTQWIDVSRGSKVFNAELAGRYFIFSN